MASAPPAARWQDGYAREPNGRAEGHLHRNLSRAKEALRRGSWQEARDLFQSSLAAEETPEALEGLGVAASWLDDADAAAEAREHGMRFLEEEGH